MHQQLDSSKGTVQVNTDNHIMMVMLPFNQNKFWLWFWASRFSSLRWTVTVTVSVNWIEKKWVGGTQQGTVRIMYQQCYLTENGQGIPIRLKTCNGLMYMNEWMMPLYSAFCLLLYTQSALQSWGGVSPQPPPVCSIHLDDATASTGQRCQCAHHTPATGGEERER